MAKIDLSKLEQVSWLQDGGYTAYAVGNVVRDSLLGVVSDRLDVDIATSATPNQVADLLARRRLTASLIDAKFGVVAFAYEGIRFEVTTFRRDIYDPEFVTIKRYPDYIKFVKSPKIDSARRDLTINTIYFNPASGRYIDYVGGLTDLKAGVIRMVGDPQLRFMEDPIRMLRAIRFKHQLGFRYDRKTEQALASQAGLIGKVSSAVVKKELQKLQSIDEYAQAKQDLVRFGFIKLI